MIENEVFLKAYLQDRQKIVEEALQIIFRGKTIFRRIYIKLSAIVFLTEESGFDRFFAWRRRRQLAEIWGRPYRLPVLWN